jgi:myo-inositol-1(or 4)-monophosphatase
MLAVKKGGDVLRQGFGRVENVTFKGDIDLVTEIDHLSEDKVVGFLKEKLPDYDILAEEGSGCDSGSACRWILDPLDGTTNYAHGYPCFGVSLALEYDRKIVWGAVYDPIREELFSAEKGNGAFLNNGRINVSSTEMLDRAMLCTGFPYDVRENVDDILKLLAGFLKTSQAVRRDGSAALDLCYVAMGRFDGFWEMKLKPWDIAAGALIVQEAGGSVTGFDGELLDLKRGDVLASNLLIHDEMINVIRKGSFKG